MSLPPVNPPKYNKQKYGYFGELGHGAHARIRFLQSAVTKDELDNITLIEHIPGSERWDIQDLFQRDVDMTRVEKSILPYLQDPLRVKFFNPLTLVLLPVDPATGTVDSGIPYVEPKTIKKGEHEYTQYERDGLFSYEVHSQVPAFSELQWSDSKVKLVAIDGQHRLSALKFWKSAAGPKDLDTWQIPVVILGIFRADDVKANQPANLLEIVRKTFVYINSRAEDVNESRLILLDDEAISSVCTQELVQASHRNDCLPDKLMKKEKLPLFVFDWRGQARWRDDGSEATEAPGSILSIVEIRDWLSEYLLGDNDWARTVLQLDDLDPPLSESFMQREILSHDDSLRIRKRFNELVLPGMSSLLEQFDPFKEYVVKVRELEVKRRAESEAFGHAFQKLRFGSPPPLLGKMKDLVDQAYSAVVEQLKNLRSDCFDELVDRDIGKRAVIYAFAALKEARDEFSGKTGSWKSHAEWFAPKLNQIYKAGWFKPYADLKKEQSRLLTHICFDSSGSIVNYKLGDVPKASGLFFALLIASQALKDFDEAQKDQLWDTYGEELDSALRKGFRRDHRAQLKDTFKGTHLEFVAAVNEKAAHDVTQRLKLIKKKLLSGE